MISEDGIDVCGGDLHWIDDMNGEDYYRCEKCDTIRFFEDFCGNEDYKKVIRNNKINELLDE